MSDFDKINKLTSQSFKNQKGLIKRVLAGKASQCPECSHDLMLVLPKESAGKSPGIYCKKGCTDIELEMEQV
ncbi:hypothetical protein D5018_07505 [Parashewanella curva]|uniref:Uncharacterized protein n=1 Tax=Parashewanella curva TaxID=2338552 RepID=A0A3L8Q224_9GAMM|nr:hypothetical protein [Parashewanella curva]RLV60362.1 hypothetical protein D5018_07505 [Parashewanella curva]